MNDWSPFLDLSDRAAFIRTSVAVYMSIAWCQYGQAEPQFALTRALADWERIRQAMREEKGGGDEYQ